MGLIAKRVLRVLRANSVRENFEQSKRDLEGGYPITLVQEILTEVNSPTETRLFATEQNKRDFTVCYYYIQHLQCGHTESQKDSHETLGHHSTATLKHIFHQPPIVSYRKEISLKDTLVRAKIPSMISQQSQNQRSGLKAK